MSEPLHGLYSYTRRDGLVLLVQWHHGRPVEVMQTHTRYLPKRLTRRRLGDSVTEWLTRERLRRWHAAIALLTPDGWEGPRSPQTLREVERRASER